MDPIENQYTKDTYQRQAEIPTDEAQCGTSMVESMKVSGTKVCTTDMARLYQVMAQRPGAEVSKTIENMGQENFAMSKLPLTFRSFMTLTF